MKKLSLLLCAFAFAQAVSAQNSFVVMPEIQTGIAVIDLLGDDDYKASFHFNIGLTLGVTQSNDKGTNFYGMYLARNGYGHTGENPHRSGEDCTISRGSFNLGMQFLHRTNFGLMYGGIVGLNKWDKEYSAVSKEHSDTYNGDGNSVFSLKAKVGYCWSHVGLYMETGYNQGVEFNWGVAFPLYSAK